jgi:2-C-methyl-D-erythritol 4-phosphate cytidylyltransferase/2-C-methyl-D-erythritol 2,4-cyclodiphosphate synthase
LSAEKPEAARLSALTGIADAVIVAAGASTRMRGRDKLEAPIGGRPVLAWAIRAFAMARVVGRIVVVTAPDRVEAVADAGWLPDRITSVVTGGRRRQETVAAGFAELERLGIPDDRVVLVHDGARPAVGAHLVHRVALAAAEHGAAVPVRAIADTVKRVRGGVVVETVDRTDLATAETPQGVRAGLLRQAYDRFPPDGERTFTDEAALLEACSIRVHVVPGQVAPDNLKITTPTDLQRAAMLMAVPLVRVGFGHDSHPFGPGGPLVLGGVALTSAPRLHGHSDGDVVLHAVADALLGAAGQGDLGRLFPPDDRTPRGIDSAELLGEAVSRVRALSREPASVDVTVIAARPRLGPHLDAMRARIADVLAIDELLVNVKASTGNLHGMEGAGRGISAEAVVEVVERP